MIRGSYWLRSLAVLVFSASAFLSLHAAGHKQTFTGEVGDSMCGKKHMEGETAADCTRACVSHGSNYALIVGDKVYTLQTSDKAALTALDLQAGKVVTVTGVLNGDSIEVSSVAAK
jgi:hypothetical protein